MENLLRALARIEKREPFALVTVIAVSGSAPRHVGAKMLVNPAGAIESTIGGGVVEHEITQLAKQVAVGAPAQRVRHHLTRDLAMCCGGSMTFYVEPGAASESALRQAIQAWEARTPCLLVTPFDGSGKFVRPMPDPVQTAITCDDDELVEPILPRSRSVIFGCGHVSRALGPMLAGVGFEVIICDDGETEALSTVEGAPWLTGIVESFDVREVEDELGPLGVSDHVFIVTRDHAVDQEILERVIGNPSLNYLGMIGSRRKIARFRKRLTAKGLYTDESWARLHAPIGLEIGAETPAEIAIAVTAELVQLRRLGDIRSGQQTDDAVSQRLGEESA